MLSAKGVEKKILRQSTLRDFVTPDYRGLGIANIIPTILAGFGLPSSRGLSAEAFDPSLLKGVKNIVLLCLDGLGYNLLKKGTFLRRMEGFPLTSVAPSTTTAALSTLATGLTPQEHGIVGFWVYLRELGEVVNMLRFGPAGEMGSYQDVGIVPEIFFPAQTAFEALRKRGVKSFVVNKGEYANSPLSQMIYRGAETVPYQGLREMFAKAQNILLGKGGRKFVYLYWETIDMVSHQHGTRSRELVATLGSLERELERFLKKPKEGTLFLLTADHGHINIPLRRTENFLDHPHLLHTLSSPPSGDSRIVYLFSKKGKRESLGTYLERNFSRKAVVMDSRDFLKKGFLGIGGPLKETRERVGDFVLIAKRDYRFTFPYLEGPSGIGFHGGLSREEMLVPLLWKRL